MLRMHYKTLKCKKISLDEKKIIKIDQGMLDLTKTYFPINFHTFMMNISHDFNRKVMLVRFNKFRPKAHLHIVVNWFFGYNSFVQYSSYKHENL